ncbi:hypothetical protein FOXB_17146, partial [Fusarium oxysporum f. sp. conglutinans Fo5176]|jgi:hypothetical protein
LKG